MPIKNAGSWIKKALLGACVVAGVACTSTRSWGFAIIGSGWDGSGRGSATLTYHFGTLTADLRPKTVKKTLQAALGVWDDVAVLKFRSTTSAGLWQSIDFEFATKAHGDGFPFDGPGGTLAHAFYPAPPNPEPLAGDVHFDDAELWEVGNGLGSAAFDLMWVAVHEIGHALGLGHSSVSGAVMFPTVSKSKVFTELHPDDIAGIQSLYAARTPKASKAVLTNSEPGTAVLANPEPGTFVLLGTGLLGLLVYGCQRRKQTP